MLSIYLSFAYQCSMKMAIINGLNMFEYSPVFVDKQILLCNWLEVKFIVQVFPFAFVTCVWTKNEKVHCTAIQLHSLIAKMKAQGLCKFAALA